MISYEETSGFAKDFKRLSKKFMSLAGDLEVVKKAVIELRHSRGLDNRATFQIPGYGGGNVTFWKIKKFACRSLKGSGAQSGIRIIYVWHADIRKIVFLEIYFKGEQTNEDRERIKAYVEGANV